MALKFYAPVEFDDTSSGLTIDGDLIVDTSTLFVDVSTDRVGIGTASPLTYLHVKGTSSGNTFSNLEGLLVETGGSSNSYYAVQVATAGGGKSFNVTNAGNIGIGTTSPAKKLDVNGDSYIRTSGTGQTLLIGRTSSQPTIKADSSNGGYLILDSLNNFLSLNHYVSQNVVANNGGGNFLIGTATDSGYKLDVNGEINSTYTVNNGVTFKKSFNIGNISAGSTYTLGQLDFGGTFTHHFRVIVSSYAGFKEFNFHGYQASLNKSSSGHNSQPNRYSDIDIVVEKVVDVSSNITGVKIGVQNGSSNADYVYSATVECLSLFDDWTDLSSGTALTAATIGESTRRDIAGGVVYVDENNLKVGINTNSPSESLEVSGNIQASGSRFIRAEYDSNHYMQLESNSSGGILKGLDGGTTTVLVRSYGDSYFNGGNLGIGTASPSTKLQVSGIIRAENNGQSLDLVGTDHVYQAWYPRGTSSGRKAYMGFASGSTTSFTIMNEDTGDFKIGTNSTERIRIASAGNIGIGTTAPASKLHVSGAGSGTFRAESTSSDYPIRISGYQTTADSFIGVDQSNKLKFYVSNGDRMVINSAGNIGIGTSTPGAPLDVKSNSGSSANSGIRLISNSTSNVVAAIGERSTDGGRFHLYDAGVEKIALYTDGTANHISAGNVGIGTSSPSTKLHVNGTFKSAGIQDSANALAIFINGNEEVGIGTTTPSQKLEVIGNINAGAGAADNYLQAKHSDSAYTRVHGYGLYMSRSSSYIRPTTDNAKNLYVGTSDKQWSLLSLDASTTTFSVNGSESLRVNSSGNVLIGTTTDNGSKLRVNGDSEITGDLTVTSGSANEGDRIELRSADAIAEVRANGESTSDESAIFLGTPYTAGSYTAPTKAAIIAQGVGTYSRSKMLFCLEDTASNFLTATVTSADAKMALTKEGKLGVNKTTPSYEVDAGGDINADGDFYQNGTQGWTGTININTNPPIAIDVQGGIITNVT